MQSITDFFTIVYQAPFIAQLFIMSFSIVFVFTTVERNFKSIRNFILKILACFAIHSAYSLLLFVLSNYCNLFFYYNYFIAYFLSILTCCLIFSKIDKRSNAILIATLFGMEVTVSQLEHSLMLLSLHDVNHYLQYFISIVLFSLIGVFAIIVHNHSISKLSHISGNSVFLVCSVNTVFILLICVYLGITGYVFSSSESGDLYFLITLFAFYILEILVYFLVYQDLKKSEDNSNLRLEKKMLEADHEAMAITEQSVKEIHAIRHDIKNQYLVMQTMLEENKKNELSVFLRKAGADIANIPLAADYGNKDLNTIINIETLKAHSVGVTLSVIAKVPEKFPFELNDLCSLIMNLMDNAIDATKNCEKKNIPVTCFFNVKKDYFCIVIKNPISNKLTSQEVLSFNSHKANPNLHGLGHSIVEKAVKKYNGYVEYEVSEGIFMAEAYLDMKCQEKLK
jgi:hypothetical protein